MDATTLMTVVQELVWTDQVAALEDAGIVARWRQGFQFHASEPTALQQLAGGPCGVLAPVQAHLLCTLQRPGPDVPHAGDWRHPHDADAVWRALATALADMLATCARASRATTATLARSDLCDNPELVPARLADLHASVTLEELPLGDGAGALAAALFARRAQLQSPWGVILFLYSCVCTRGLDEVHSDLGFDSEPLISQPFGHANQSLINLMLTGKATPYVHDGVQDVGIQLEGVVSQPRVGYLTLMETLRYCSVGSFLKSPAEPAWVVGSESHMTVAFSLDPRLVAPEGPVSAARRVFAAHDPTGGGFVAPDELPLVLAALGRDATPAAVAELVEAADRDQLGVILLTNFLQALFKTVDVPKDDNPEQFVLYFYNGMARPGVPYAYSRGTARVEAPSDFGSPPVTQALRTKWSTLTIDWEGQAPSIQ